MVNAPVGELFKNMVKGRQKFIKTLCDLFQRQMSANGLGRHDPIILNPFLNHHVPLCPQGRVHRSANDLRRFSDYGNFPD